jgi:integrase
MTGLTVRQIEAAKPKDKPYKLADGNGLYLYVSTAGGKSFRANYSVRGKQQTRTYGRWPDMTLADARKAHQAARETPDTMRAMAPAFRAVAKEWLLKHLPSLSNPKHRLQVENTLETYAYPKVGDLPIDQIPRKLLTEVVQGIQSKDGGKVETAHRVAGRITSVFDYAQDAGYIEAHPAANLTRVLIPRKVKKPMASIPPSEAGALLRAIHEYPETVTRLGLLLVAHTFVRVGEALGFRRDELREDGAMWVVPAERVKGAGDKKLPHVVPLSPQAQAIVKQLSELTDGDLLLESPAHPGHPLSENTLLFALYRLGYRGRMTVHGFRALASTVLNEQSSFPHDVIERQLAHKETDQVRAAYNRAEYLPARRELMNWWSRWLESAAADQPPASESGRQSSPAEEQAAP